MANIKDEFLINEEVIFLNHGSFGACPRPVFETYQHWQRILEKQPVEFLGRHASNLMANTREKLAAYLHTEAENIVYFPNPTTAINMVARSLDLEAGDQILTTDHEYGAMDRTWRYICSKSGAVYKKLPIQIPVTNHANFVETFLAGITPQTRMIFISHITSPTALIFPVAEICQLAKEAGIICIVDGAHAPGQIPVDLNSIGADIYTGACHKWLCAPKGSAFLYAEPEMQPLLEPLVVSWGYEAEVPGPSQFIDYHEWQGTRDLAAFLSVPRAIQFQEENQWEGVHQRCYQLALDAHQKINALTNMEPISPNNNEWIAQMVSLRLPISTDPDKLKERLYGEYHIEVPVFLWNGIPIIRISFQAYNDAADLDALLKALQEFLSSPDILV
jgi:isopenicillin-N epimerase